MLFKIFGTLTLLTITAYLCYQASRLEMKRVRQAEGFLLLLRHVKAQISCFCAPTCDIFSSFENEALSDIGFLEELKKGDFCRAVSLCRDKIYLDEGEINLLIAFGHELGKGYRQQEIEGCDYYISELECAYAKKREEQPKKSRLYRSLVLTGGLMLIIVFI